VHARLGTVESREGHGRLAGIIGPSRVVSVIG